MKGNQNANMSREEFNNVQAKQVANTAYNGNEIYDKGIVRGKIFVLPEEMRNERVEITLNEGYQFVDENGNVINATKIVLEKKKKRYPKTYEECCKVLNTDDDSIIDISVPLHYNHLLISFTQLLICRDAYWKIAGEEMGLGKPWEPDWRKEGYIIYRYQDDIIGGYRAAGFVEHHIFEFPTKEIQNAFKENFDTDIKICKELL